METKCDYCHKIVTGRRFTFRVIGKLFICCSITCRKYLVQAL